MSSDLLSIRLVNQQITTNRFSKPGDLVHWFGAMQAQDFAAAKWAIGLRIKNQTDILIEKAFDNGEILRTHILRPTWHFVSPSDIRWMLMLTSPRIHRFNGYYYKLSGLDKTIFQKSNEIIRKALKGKQLTREQLANDLEKNKIPIKNLGLSYTIMQAELEGIICSGPRIGKKVTYMLLDERVPKTKEISRDEALAELVKRYFQSHGPAQIRDFVWWSGLTVLDAKKGLDLLGTQVKKIESAGKIYWFMKSIAENKIQQSVALIPGFDEYFIAYKDRSDILDKEYTKELNQGGGMINGAIIINGKMVGGWKRILEKKTITININLFEKISHPQYKILKNQIDNYGKFMDKSVIINLMKKNKDIEYG